MTSAESWSDLMERMSLGLMFDPEQLEQVRHVADASFANGQTAATDREQIMSEIKRHSEKLAKAMVG